MNSIHAHIDTVVDIQTYCEYVANHMQNNQISTQKRLYLHAYAQIDKFYATPYTIPRTLSIYMSIVLLHVILSKLCLESTQSHQILSNSTFVFRMY